MRLTLPPGMFSARLWIPRTPSDSFQTAELLEIDSPWPHKEVADPDFGNRVLYFETASVRPGPSTAMSSAT